MNKTEMMLLMKFQSPTIPLKKVCTEYFGCSEGTAKNKAKAGTLPIPAFRLSPSQKAPWMVHTQDLASYIERQHEEAKDQWVGT
ncbi:MAG: pyocin activator PrtN family protein [Cytophagales bacterium]|nr:pyocin activator PrtN family protein [Cytophagales bacterium]